MDNIGARDHILVEDENGQEKEYAVEALFDMGNQSYALLRFGDETLLMRIEDEGEQQYLVSVTDPTERDSILDAYQIAVQEAPAD